MYVDAFVDIAKAGKITGACKNIDRYRQTYAFAAGTKKLYDYLNDNPECMSAPVDYTNSIATVSSIDNFISINNAVDVDLYGQISSESSGIRQISGAGGQLDFVRVLTFLKVVRASYAYLLPLQIRRAKLIQESCQLYMKVPS
jgi:acyl-CoA hydrolase